MEQISLSKLPSYSIRIDRDGCAYAISFRSFSGMTFATVKLNGITIANSVRCVSGAWLIPYSHRMGDGGNFRFECSDDNYPYYTNFDGAAKLYYYSPSEYATETEDA